METKIPISLNIFETKSFLGSLLDLKIKYMRKLLEDFALGKKPKFYQNLGGNMSEVL